MEKIGLENFAFLEFTFEFCICVQKEGRCNMPLSGWATNSVFYLSELCSTFLFPTRMMDTFGQKCLTSGVHFSGMFSSESKTKIEHET